MKGTQETARERKGRCRGVLEIIGMTKIGQMFAQEKQDYGDFREARAYVNLVDKRVKKRGITVEEACEQLDIDPVTYEMSKALMRDKTAVYNRP